MAPSIHLYRTAGDPAGIAAEESLRDMVVGFDVTIVDEADEAPGTLPVVREGDRIVAGSAAVAGYVSDLRRFVADWNRFQSDACYIDDDGSVC